MVRHSWSGAVTISDIAGNRKLARGAEGGRRSRHRDDPAAATILAVAEGRRLRRREQGAPPRRGGAVASVSGCGMSRFHDAMFEGANRGRWRAPARLRSRLPAGGAYGAASRPRTCTTSPRCTTVGPCSSMKTWLRFASGATRHSIRLS